MSSVVDLKVVVLGGPHVGKTSLIGRYCNDQFEDDTLSTVGAGFFNHKCTVNGNNLNVMIWDTAGAERFRSVTPSLLRGANGMVLVFDLTSRSSFDELEVYMELFYNNVDNPTSDFQPVLILGNKVDMDESEVSDEDVKCFMEKHNISLYFKVSAKTGNQVPESFQNLFEHLAIPETAMHLSEKEPESKEKAGCC